MNVDIVMGLNVFFACNVRCKRTDGWAAWFWVSRQNKNACNLKTGQCAQNGGGRGGGSAEKKKDFGKPPCQLLMQKECVRFLKNTVEYCKI